MTDEQKARSIEACRVKIADGGGDTLTMYKTQNGMLLNRHFIDGFDFDAMRSLPVRDDDVVFCSYPRSGVHWTWEQARMLIEGNVDTDNFREKDVTMIEFHFYGELEAYPSPRILNSHFTFDLLPAEIEKKRTKIVLLYRNPKDVAVSYYNYHYNGGIYEYKGQFHNYLKLFKEGKLDWGSYADYLRDWERVIQEHPDLPIHVMNYETLQQNNVDELQRLSQFLGKSYDRSFLQQITEACTIDKQRVRKEEYYRQRPDINDKFVDAIYRKGKAGGWKEWFTVAQSEQFDDYWSQAMKGSTMFNFIY